jgi:GR25 family glycosyltransferase involved in LPS biosynthesis
MDKTTNQKFFSIVIPTMWKSEKIHKMLKIYENSKFVKEVILIDNEPKLKPNLNQYKKIIYYSKGENIFVNPAWNIGYTLSTYELILANDDIIIENLDEILDLFIKCDYDIVGISLEMSNDVTKIINISKFPAKSYGSFMYIKKYNYIPENIKIWYGDNFLFEESEKRGLLISNKPILNESKTINSNKNELRNNVAKKDIQFYEEYLNKKKQNKIKKNVLAVLVNYGYEQIEYLNKVITELKNFKKYNVNIIVNSNVPINNPLVDSVNIFDNMQNYQLLPLTCRTTIVDNINNFDFFIYGENDHLFKEIHLDKHLEYYEILPKNRISGLIQYEENYEGRFYPAYHKNYEWDFNSVEIYDNKIFAHFTNVHQASFILTKEQLLTISKKHNFKNFFGESKYSVKCKVNTDIYDFCDMKKMICISEFKDNLIHHLPNLYINGDLGRQKNQRSDNKKMVESLITLFNSKKTNSYYGFYLNLNKRKDRKEKIEKELLKTKHNIVRYEAIDGDTIKSLGSFNGSIKNSYHKQYATYLSHLGILKKSLLIDSEYIIILEDDITICDDFDYRLNLFINEAPNDMVIGYLGFNEQPDTIKTKMTKNIFKVKNVYGCFGMLIKKTFLPKLIHIVEHNMKAIDEVIKTEIQPKYSCYAFIPFLLYVNDDFSDIWQKNRTLDKIKKYFKTYLDNFDLSIIIPTYKNIQYIDECLNSIIESSQNQNVEVLVGVDACKETLKHIKTKNYPDFIKFYYFKENVGPYVIKNSLTQISNSNKLLFFDSDDILEKTTITEVVENLNNHDLVRLKYKEIRDNKTLEKTNFHEGAIAINKSLFLSMNGFEPWMCAADSDFLGRLYKKRPRIYHTKNLSMYYRRHSTSLTMKKETGMASPLRGGYARISKNKKGDGNPDKLHTTSFEYIDVLSYEIPKDFKYDNLVNKEKLNKVLNPTPRKVVDKKIVKSDPVVVDRLEILYKNRPEPVRTIKTNTPENRQQIIDQKNNMKNTLNSLFPKKTNPRDGKNIINIGGKFHR